MKSFRLFRRHLSFSHAQNIKHIIEYLYTNEKLIGNIFISFSGNAIHPSSFECIYLVYLKLNCYWLGAGILVSYSIFQL